MTLLSPRSPAQALRLFAREPEALPLAGGTDLMVSWNMGALNGRSVLDLSRLAQWRRIHVSAETVELGSLVTHAQAQAHATLRQRFPLLVAACATVGAAQIQNRGTIGGNIANASPAGDTFPALAVYDALVRLRSAGDFRELPFLSVFTGVKKTVLSAGELIEAVRLPIPARRPTRALFRKVGTRAAQAISKTVFAGLLWLGKGGLVEDVRLAFGSLAATVRRLGAAEARLKGRVLTLEAATEAAAVLESDCAPIDDIRSTREYRLAVSRNILLSFLAPRGVAR